LLSPPQLSDSTQHSPLLEPDGDTDKSDNEISQHRTDSRQMSLKTMTGSITVGIDVPTGQSAETDNMRRTPLTIDFTTATIMSYVTRLPVSYRLALLQRFREMEPRLPLLPVASSSRARSANPDFQPSGRGA